MDNIESRGNSEVVIAVLTFKRPDDIARIIPLLIEQAVSITPPASVLVVDNDPDGGAREDVAQASGGSDLVRYVHEPTPGIAAARNKALEEAGGARYLVFIDDDETPSPNWLRLLMTTLRDTGAQAVVGSVVSDYEIPLTDWVKAGRFFDRRRLPTGTDVSVAATNNLLLDVNWVNSIGLRFDNHFGVTGGSDTLFTRQLHVAGGRMVWNDEAEVIDRVPAKRTHAKWVLQRAYRSGNGWSRVSLYMAGSGAHIGLRARLVGRGLIRLVGGSTRALLGLLTRDMTHQAKGLRTACRGAGLLLGALGQHYSEYRR